MQQIAFGPRWVVWGGGIFTVYAWPTMRKWNLINQHVDSAESGCPFDTARAFNAESSSALCSQSSNCLSYLGRWR